MYAVDSSHSESNFVESSSYSHSERVSDGNETINVVDEEELLYGGHICLSQTYQMTQMD